VFIQTVLTAPACTIDQLNAIIAQKEDTLGPLQSVGNDGVKSTLGFDVDPPSPAVKAVLRNGPAPAGTIVICQGVVFISGTITQVYATR